MFAFVSLHVKYNFCYANAQFPIASSLPCIVLPRHERFEKTAGDTDRSGAGAADLCARAKRRETVRAGTAGFAGETGEGNPRASGVRLRCGRSGRRRHYAREPGSVLPVADRAADAAGCFEARLERGGAWRTIAGAGFAGARWRAGNCA